MTNKDAFKAQLLTYGFTDAEAAKYVDDDGTPQSLAMMDVNDLVTEVGMTKNRARHVLTRIKEPTPKEVTTSTDKLIDKLTNILPQNLEVMSLAQLWNLLLQDSSRTEVRTAIEKVTTRRGQPLAVFVKRAGVVDPDLSQACLASLNGKRFVPSKGFTFRGFPTFTLNEALRTREFASPIDRDPLQDQGDGVFVDSKGVNWGPIMPGTGNGRAVWLTLAQLPQIQMEWGDDLVPDNKPRTIIRELKGEIDEDSDFFRLRLAYEDARTNNPVLVAEAEAMLDLNSTVDPSFEIEMLERRLTVLRQRAGIVSTVRSPVNFPKAPR